jgi:O-antigen/teichoic acid export membrane protein
MKRVKLNGLLSRLGLNQVARGALQSLFLRTVALILGFVQSVLLARLLGPEGLGVFAVIVSMITVVVVICSFGFESFAVREVSRLLAQTRLGLVKGFIAISTSSIFVSSLLCGVAIAWFANITHSQISTELQWAILLIPLMALLALAQGISLGFSKVVSSQAPIFFVRPGLMTGCLLIAWLSMNSLTTSSALGLLVAANMITLIFAIIVSLNTVNPLIAGTSLRFEFAGWVRESVPFWGLGLLSILHAQLITLMLGWLSGSREAGLYQPLLGIASVMIIGLLAVNAPLSPRVSSLWESGDQTMLRRTVWLATITSTTVVLSTCIALVMAAPYVLLVFGSEFVNLVAAIRWIAAAQVFNAACGSVGVLLNMTGHQRSSYKIQFIMVVITMAMGFLVIPSHGALGGAIVFFASTVIWNILLLQAVKKRLGFDPSILTAIRGYFEKS